MVEPITVACEHCRSKLKLKSAAAAGKKIACPKCKKVFTVKVPAGKKNDDEHLFDDLPLEDFPMSEEEQEEEEQKAVKKAAKTAAKKKAKRKEADSGSLLMIALLLLVGVGVIGGGAYAVMKFLPGGSGTMTAYLPDEIDTLIHVRVADMLGTPFFAPLVAEPKVKEAIEQGALKTGLRPTDIESVSVGLIGFMTSQGREAFGPVNAKGFERFVAVIRTRAPLDIDKFKTNLQIPTTAANHNGKDYFTTAAAGKLIGYYRPNESTLIIAPEAELKTAIDSGGSTPAGSRFRFVDQKQHFVWAQAPKDASIFRTHGGEVAMKLDSSTGAKTEITDNLVLGKSTGITVGSDIVYRDIIRLNSSSTAKNSLQSVKDEFEESKKSFVVVKSQLSYMNTPGMPFADSPRAIVTQVEKSLADATVTQSGADVVTQITVPGTLVEDIKKMAMVFAQLAESGMGGMLMPGGMSPPGLPPGLPPGSPNAALPQGLPLPPDAAAAAAAAGSASPPADPQIPASASPPAANPAAPPP